ncbi:ArgE/DapE family deacylase [Enterococcus ureilyticus]|uniref:ArgE/DapE family deacylase n=1 Tax=Enterococcus ureilyticus TaxID=1131292 RepID=UPI001A9210C6|nr:ArgE/DapE family deacylase [Enterococcus ureilyticus]MBO0446457.1 ArgE/DapE family deacylase [Enterococcus ureilyticus]
MEKQEKIQILKDLVAIKSVNGNEKEVAEYLSKLFKKHGIDSSFLEYDKDRDNLIVEIGNKNSEKVLAFSGHMDVVSAGNVSDWTSDPFKPEIRDGKMYGRGTCDMKSGLAAMAIAMIELKEEKAEFNGRLRLIATVGEEVGELGAEQLTKEGYVDDVTSMVIGEPSGYAGIVYAHKGSINFKVASLGKNAHSSMPQLGVNAIDHLNDFYSRANQLFRSEIHTDEVLGDFIYNVTMISGGEQINSIPSEASLQGNIRTIPGYDNELVIKKMNELIDELNQKEMYHLTLSIEANKISVKSEKDSDIAKIAQQVAKKQVNVDIPMVGISGTTDAAEFTKGKKVFPVIIFGPGNETPHQVDEYVDVDNYLEMVAIYKEMATIYLD